jgi:hypothetical protein
MAFQSLAAFLFRPEDTFYMSGFCYTPFLAQLALILVC